MTWRKGVAAFSVPGILHANLFWSVLALESNRGFRKHKHHIIPLLNSCQCINTISWMHLPYNNFFYHLYDSKVNITDLFNKYIIMFP